MSWDKELEVSGSALLPFHILWFEIQGSANSTQRTHRFQLRHPSVKPHEDPATQGWHILSTYTSSP